MLLQFSDFQKSSFTTIFNFGSLIMVLDLLASFHFESKPIMYTVFILQCTRKVNSYTLTFSYIFQVLVFSHIYFYSHLIELSKDLAKNLDQNLSPIKASQFVTGTLIVLLCIIFQKSNR